MPNATATAAARLAAARETSADVAKRVTTAMPAAAVSPTGLGNTRLGGDEDPDEHTDGDAQEE